MTGSRVTGARGGARRLCWSGRGGAGGSVPLSRLADCQPLPGGWWGRARTQRARPLPMSHRGSRGLGRRGNRGCQSWNGGSAGSRHGTRGRPTRDLRPRKPTSAGPLPHAGHLNGGRSPQDRGPGCHPRRGRPLTPRQGPNNIRAREVGGARGRLRRGPWDAVGATQTDGCQDLPSGSRILSRAAAAAASAGRGAARATPPATTRWSMLGAQPHAPPSAPRRPAHRPASLRPSPDLVPFLLRCGLWEGEGCTWTQAGTSASETRNSERAQLARG